MSYGKLEVSVQGAVEVKDSSIPGKGSPYCTLTMGSQEYSTPSNEEELSLEVPSLLDHEAAFDILPSKRHMTEEDSSSQSSDDDSLRPSINNPIATPEQNKAQQKFAVPYPPPGPPPSIGQEQPYSTVIRKALLVNRPTRLHRPRGGGRGPFNPFPLRPPGGLFNPLPSKRFMTEEDSSSDDDNASAPHEISQYQQPRRRTEPPLGPPPPRRPTPLSNTNTNSLLQTFGGASMQNVGGAVLYHDGDGADWGGGGGCDDKEVLTTSYGSAPEECVENYDVVVKYDDTECSNDDVETIDGFEESQDATDGAPGYELLRGRERAESPDGWGANKRRKTQETTTSCG